jgi:hypothetical protein
MTHIVKSERWLGYAALLCAAFVVIVPRFSIYSQPFFGAAVICVAVLGVYSGMRGFFVGSKLSRVCAALTWPYWAWIIFSLLVALMRAKIR